MAPPGLNDNVKVDYDRIGASESYIGLNASVRRRGRDELQRGVQNIGNIHWGSWVDPTLIIVTVIGKGGNSGMILYF